MKEAVITAVIGAVVGGSGVFGLVFIYFRRFIDKRLDKKDAEQSKKKDLRLRRLTIENEMEHALGRLLFYLHKAIVTGQHNGDLKEAWESYQVAEAKKKALDREIIVDNEMGE